MKIEAMTPDLGTLSVKINESAKLTGTVEPKASDFSAIGASAELKSSKEYNYAQPIIASFGNGSSYCNMAHVLSS